MNPDDRRFKRPLPPDRHRAPPAKVRPVQRCPPRTPIPDRVHPQPYVDSPRPHVPFMPNFRIPRTAGPFQHIDSFAGYIPLCSASSSDSLTQTDDDASSVASRSLTVYCNDPESVPLSQFILPLLENRVVQVAKPDGNVDEDAAENVSKLSKSLSGYHNNDRTEIAKSNVVNLVERLAHQQQLPLIIFGNTDHECESFLIALKERNFTCLDVGDTACLREHLHHIQTALQQGGKSRTLEQLVLLEPYLLRGIGLITNGIDQALVDINQALFRNGIIKVLVIPESLSALYDFKGRSVLISSALKPDGPSYRQLTSSEYYRMARYAGRCGIDDYGLTIMMVQHAMAASDIVDLAKCKLAEWESPDNITRFKECVDNPARSHLSQEQRQELFESFLDFLHISNSKKELAKAKAQAAPYEGTERIPDLQLFDLLDDVEHKIMEIFGKAEYCIPYLRPCHVLRIETETVNYGYCVLLDLKMLRGTHFLHVACFVEKQTDCNDFSKMKPYDWVNGDSDDRSADVAVIMVSLDCLRAITTKTVRCPPNLTDVKSRRILVGIMRHILQQSVWGFDLPELDPVKDMKIEDPKLPNLILEKSVAKDSLRRSSYSENLAQTRKYWWNKMSILRAVDRAKQDLKDKEAGAEMFLAFKNTESANSNAALSAC